MNVVIENYRGFDIIFVTETERFTFSLDGGTWKDKQSYAACKKNIDDYLKENTNFKPFDVRFKTNPDQVFTIIGIRKDGDFTFKNAHGESGKISKYDEKNLIVVNKEDDVIYKKIKELEGQIERLESQVGSCYNSIKSKTLQDLKSNFQTP